MKKRKNIGAMKRVKEYRQKGLTFRAISGIMGKNVRQIYRWYKYGLKSYPLRKVLTRKTQKIKI